MSISATATATGPIAVSVVMPLRNAAKYLPQALDSILAQTLAEWELIAVCEPDSKDNTNEIVRGYAAKDKRVRPVFNASRLGIAASLNIGIRAARGEFVARMDGDDICAEERFQKQADFLRQRGDIAICGSDIQFIDQKGRRRAHKTHYPAEHEQIKSDLLFYCEIMHPAVMMRKAAIEKYNLYYDESFGAAEDFELWNRASRVVKLANINEILLGYRWGMDTATRANAQAGDSNYIAVIDRSCRQLGLAFSPEELRLLYPRACGMKLSNAGRVKRTLEHAARRIAAANAERGIYDEAALEATLAKRLYWKRHPIRGYVAAALRSIGGGSALACGAAGYLEQRGFGMTVGRIVRLG